jgi:gamma-glutamyltranspeptidase/glutathione hydrolase
MPDPFEGNVDVECGVSVPLQQQLRGLGHRVTQPSKPIGGSQAIWIDWDEGVLTGGSDPRKDGCAIGY